MERDQIAQDLKTIISGQATIFERVDNLRRSVDKRDETNETQHREFFNRIGVVEQRITVMERVDDPGTVSDLTYRKVMLDALKILIPIIVTVLGALKIAKVW
jgi:hypothetical protein